MVVVFLNTTKTALDVSLPDGKFYQVAHLPERAILTLLIHEN
jgi:hypothetical protein